MADKQTDDRLKVLEQFKSEILKIMELSERANPDGSEYIPISLPNGEEYRMLSSSFFNMNLISNDDADFTLTAGSKNSVIEMVGNDHTFTIPNDLAWFNGARCFVIQQGTGLSFAYGGSVTHNEPQTLADEQYSIYLIIKRAENDFNIVQLGAASGGGGGTDDQNASEVPLLDVGSNFVATNVEDGLIEINDKAIPAGGTAAQVLSKIDATNYNTAWVNAPTGVISGIYDISVGDNPQVVFDGATAGSLIRFLPGLHNHGINNNSRTQNAILYVDKPMSIEIMAGATLKLANNTIPLGSGTDAEITINHGEEKTLDDMSMGATSNYTGGVKQDYYVEIDSAGATDTFEWGYFEAGNIRNSVQTGVAITGAEQTLELGIKIQFGATTGHSLGSLWVVHYDGGSHWGIRIGEGFHTSYIENTYIFGEGTIDLNRNNNVQPSILAAETSACVLVHGRVRYHSTKDITMIDGHRSFMAYGDNDSAAYYYGGGVGADGTSFDAEYIDVIGTKTYSSNDEDAGIELGHPSHRGVLKYVRCNQNIIHTNNTCIEPNYGLRDYEVKGNQLKIVLDKAAITCWRRSDNGYIADNVLIGDETGTFLPFRIISPGGWEDAQNITAVNNYNVNAGAVTPFPPAVIDPLASENSPTDNMIAYYPLATNSNESLGLTSGINGSDTGITYASGEAQFNGSTSFIDIPHNDIFSFTDGVNDTPYTIAFKVKYNDATSAFLINKGTGSTANREWSIGNSIVTTLNVQNIDNATNTLDTRRNGWSRATGVYYDVIATYDGAGDLRIYLDGVRFTDSSSVGTYVKMANLGTSIIIGKTGWTNAHFLNGSMKDIRFYNEAKTQVGVDAIIAL